MRDPWRYLHFLGQVQLDHVCSSQLQDTCKKKTNKWETAAFSYLQLCYTSWKYSHLRKKCCLVHTHCLLSQHLWDFVFFPQSSQCSSLPRHSPNYPLSLTSLLFSSGILKSKAAQNVLSLEPAPIARSWVSERTLSPDSFWTLHK